MTDQSGVTESVELVLFPELTMRYMQCGVVEMRCNEGCTVFVLQKRYRQFWGYFTILVSRLMTCSYHTYKTLFYYY